MRTFAHALYGEGHSLGWQVCELTVGVGFRAVKGLHIPPLSVKWYTGPGPCADDALARLHQTPLGPEGRGRPPGPTHAARSVQGA